MERAHIPYSLCNGKARIPHLSSTITLLVYQSIYSDISQTRPSSEYCFLLLLIFFGSIQKRPLRLINKPALSLFQPKDIDMWLEISILTIYIFREHINLIPPRQIQSSNNSHLLDKNSN